MGDDGSAFTGLAPAQGLSSPVSWLQDVVRWGGAVPCLEILGIKKEEQAPGTAKERHRPPQSPPHPHQICEAFHSISRKIYEKPNSIEELAELREWMKGIPEKLVELEVRHTREGWGPVFRSLVELEVLVGHLWSRGPGRHGALAQGPRAGDRQELGDQAPGGWR